MSIMVTADIFETIAVTAGHRQDMLDGRRYRTTTDARGCTVIGPLRHRKLKGMQQQNQKQTAKNAPTITTGFTQAYAALGSTTKPSPAPPSLGRRFRLTHAQVQHLAVDVLTCSLAVAGLALAGVAVRALVWAWS